MAKKKTANAKPDYETIRKKMVYLFILKGIPVKDVEDLAQEVCVEVAKSYNPNKEKHPDKPGEALAYKISFWVYAKYIKKIKKIPQIKLLGDETEVALGNANREPNSQKEGELQDEVRLVTQWIDKWFKTLTPWEQTIWELRFIHDMDVIKIGILVRGEQNIKQRNMRRKKATYHGAGYRAITPIFIKFVEFLEPKIAEHVNWTK